MSHDPGLLDLQHQALIDQRSAIGDMPMSTPEEKLARFEARAQVNRALAEVYAAKQRDVEPGTVVSQALVVAARDSRESAEHAERLAQNVRARITAAREGDAR
jgi:hypothetical protein